MSHNNKPQREKSRSRDKHEIPTGGTGKLIKQTIGEIPQNTAPMQIIKPKGTTEMTNVTSFMGVDCKCRREDELY